MRNAFCQALVEAASRPEFVFLTGDLGYRRWSRLREALGSRFINAGVAEQNMVSVAAGLARSGLRPWVYSIAPFVYARPFEQIRNDVCLHDFRSCWWATAVAMATASWERLTTLSRITARCSACLTSQPTCRHSTWMSAMIVDLFSTSHPAYLRLGVSEEPKDAAVPALCALAKAPGRTGLGRSW